jgi:sterol desaturase/sphingolipid hydroxylase (fatty acid hydroxylase superfamily)
MSFSFLTSLREHYQWLLSLYALGGIVIVSLILSQLTVLVPAFRDAGRLNAETLRKKMERPSYAANHRWNRKWAVPFFAVIFTLVLPFCLTLDAKPWWRMLIDIVAILMFYDFFYYLMHRFLFHDSRFLGGPLKWMHAVHHRQHNPCKMDASYIHPLEVALGLGLYTASIFILSRFMGNFHVATIVITWIVFSRINLHNHALWNTEHFPFGYLNYMSKMHHNHHARFTGGNFATISLLYDWMFGTLDTGQGYGKEQKPIIRR